MSSDHPLSWQPLWWQPKASAPEGKTRKYAARSVWSGTKGQTSKRYFRFPPSQAAHRPRQPSSASPRWMKTSGSTPPRPPDGRGAARGSGFGAPAARRSRTPRGAGAGGAGALRRAARRWGRSGRCSPFLATVP